MTVPILMVRKLKKKVLTNWSEIPELEHGRDEIQTQTVWLQNFTILCISIEIREWETRHEENKLK